MAFTKQDLIERSGLPDRTIRNYIGRGLIPPPRGHGLAAEYDDEAMVRAVGIGRMRAGAMSIFEIEAYVQGWSTAKWKRYVRDTDPAPPEPPAAPPRPADETVEAEPVLPGPSHRARLGDGGDRHAPIEAVEGDVLPDAPAWRLYSLVTGLGLMVDVDAPPIVHRIAAEILARYGQRRAR